jgi:hypothetical protein
MTAPRLTSRTVGCTLFALLLSSCGGGRGSTGVSGGGGSGFSISALSPSTVVVGTQQGQVTVLGRGFSASSQVLVDGQPVQQTIFTDAGTLQAAIATSLSATAGTHQFSVQDGGQASNSLSFTVYALQQGPFVMNALPGFLVGENLNDAPFIVAADINGDGLTDVIMPGPGLTNSQSVAVLYG